MGKINEAQLKAGIASGKLERVYLLYGDEDFLVKTYVDKIISAAVPESARDMNFTKFDKLPKADELSDITDNLPFFSEYKCVLIQNPDPAGLDISETKKYFELLKNISETTVLIAAQRDPEFTLKGLKEKPKKFFDALEKAGVSCELSRLPQPKLADMTIKKFAGAGFEISYQNACYLASECGGGLTLLQIEIEKLCAFKSQSTNKEITIDDIEALVPKRLETNIYNLSKELFAGRTGNAMRILDILFTQNTDAGVVLSVLSGHFIDLYRAKLGLLMKKTSSETVEAFKYAKNRAFVVENAYRSAKNLSKEYLGNCLAILYDVNRLVNSSKISQRLMIERAVAEISALPKK